MTRAATDRGAVTAELAVALPAVVIVLALGVGALGAAGQHVRLQDAAADAARLLARGDDAGRAESIVASAAPGARMRVESRGDLVCVTATATAPVGLDVPVTASACALDGGR